MEGAQEIQISKASALGVPAVDGQPVQDFKPLSCKVEKDISGVLGVGNRMTICSSSAGTGLTRTCVLETSEEIKGAIYARSTYQAGEKAVAVTGFVDNEFELFHPGKVIWSYNGGGEGPMHYYDTIQKIDLTTADKFSRENRQDGTAASIPAADIYGPDGGILAGDASVTRREVHTPIRETADSAQISIWRPGKRIEAGQTVEAGQSFLVVHRGDYFNGLRGYKLAMERLGMVMQTTISSRSYEPRWEGWGWGTEWTADMIINKLDELQAAGVKQITIDDAWYASAGDWELNPEKFPNGKPDMLRLTNAIHAHGMTAILWWRPCDGGTNSNLFRQHPEYYVMDADGNRVKLKGAGGTNANLGYALCPSSPGAVASQTAFIDRAMNEWGFDGFKGDYVWSIPHCHDPSHHHAYPEESTEKESEIYRASRAAMVANDPKAFNLLCNCGTPQDYYSLRYMTQVVTADPTSLDQTRRRVKAYKALMGDNFPVTTDHNDIWYPSTIGTGAVMIEKRALTGYKEAEYERWLEIANREQLHKGRFIGGLYSYGFDPYETYVVEKDGVMYYAFYRDGTKYSPTGYPAIELRGLDPAKLYRIVDYIKDRVVATNLRGDSAIFQTRFATELLVKAVELTGPEEPVDPDAGYLSVAAGDEALHYTGTWKNARNAASGAAVELAFIGTSVRWYGQKGPRLGTVEVYVDDALKATVDASGDVESGVQLFEAFNLPAAVHTLKLVCRTGGVDVERIAYEPADPDPVYEKVDALSDRIKYAGTWELEENEAFYGGRAKQTRDPKAYAEFTFKGTAICWYGRKSFHFGMADVYLDGKMMEAVTVYGQDFMGQLLFQQIGMTPGEHTIRVTYNGGTFDVDYFAYSSDE